MLGHLLVGLNVSVGVAGHIQRLSLSGDTPDDQDINACYWLWLRCDHRVFYSARCSVKALCVA